MTNFSDATVRVRYAETDQMGVVYHGNYFAWFEVGRVELCRALGFQYKNMEAEDNCYIVVADAQCRYKRPARFDDLLRVRTRVIGSTKRTIRFGYEIFRDAENGGESELIATGETIHVVCDREGRPRSLPEKYRQYFALNEPATDGDAGESAEAAIKTS
jgi:acyl-CoA thioester hydrolase